MTIRINGKSFESPDGSDINIINGNVIVGGKVINSFDNKEFKIEVIGNVNLLTTDNGNVHVNGDVSGSVSAGGNVKCDDISGNVSAGGSVKCGDIGGSISAGGSVKSS